MHKDFDHHDMVANILTYRRSASASQEQAGREWYPTARDIVDLIAERCNNGPYRVAYALAALSPRNPWRWNVADCYSFASARAEGRTMPSASTFKRNQAAAWLALAEDGAPWLTAAPKVTAFVDCIMGSLTEVCIDTWAVRVATGGARSAVNGDRQYAAVAAAYREAADIIGEATAETQAITWLVARAEGTARQTATAHTFKAGTPDFIRAALSEGVSE